MRQSLVDWLEGTGHNAIPPALVALLLGLPMGWAMHARWASMGGPESLDMPACMLLASIMWLHGLGLWRMHRMMDYVDQRPARRCCLSSSLGALVLVAYTYPWTGLLSAHA